MRQVSNPAATGSGIGGIRATTSWIPEAPGSWLTGLVAQEHSTLFAPTPSMSSAAVTASSRQREADSAGGGPRRLSRPSAIPPSAPLISSATAVSGSLEALAIVVEDLLQLKYGLTLDTDDFVRKVEANCRPPGDRKLQDLDPFQIVSSFNSCKDLRFRSRDGQRLLALRLSAPRRLEGFGELLREVGFLLGTSCAVAIVDAAGKLSRAVAVFREDYSRPHEALIGRCLPTEPLVSFSAEQLRCAMTFDPEVYLVLRRSSDGEISAGATVQEPVPMFREEYRSLAAWLRTPSVNTGPVSVSARAVEQIATTKPEDSSGMVWPSHIESDATTWQLGAVESRNTEVSTAGLQEIAASRQGLADALMERRAAEATQPSVVAMAMDWLWPGRNAVPGRPRQGVSAPPSSTRAVQQRTGGYPITRAVPSTPLIPPTENPSKPPKGITRLDTARPPAPLALGAAIGQATLSRVADSPETPPAARMRQGNFDPSVAEMAGPRLIQKRPSSRPPGIPGWGMCS